MWDEDRFDGSPTRNTCSDDRSPATISSTTPLSSSWDDEPIGEMEKPQDKFEPKVDNSDSPFKPALRSKPNAIQPLKIYSQFEKDGTEFYCHPYMPELNSFNVPQRQLKSAEPIPPTDTSVDDDITLVDDVDALAAMMDDLRTVTEIGVDSEYHSFRSFFGFTCLLQISTRTRDYVIDAISLRNKLEVLNEYFTDPKILKVMHAAQSDVIWLQKDLNLYVVNLFDTSIAASKLGCRQFGLATLLKQYCCVNIEKNKEFQKYFDWRTRPLPHEALLYSRDDTHYLLYLYDILRNRLINKANYTIDLLMNVYNESTNLCKKTFRKSSSESGLAAFLRKCKKDNRTVHAMKSLYRWRDTIAREKDESTGYVLPNKMLTLMVEKLPQTPTEIEDCCWPSVTPPLVEENLAHLLELILEARRQPETANEDPLRVKVKTCSQSTQTENVDTQSTQTEMFSRSTQTEPVD